MGKVRLTKVLMDGGSGLNILYADTHDKMKDPKEQPSTRGSPFYGVVLGMQAIRLG